MSELDLTQERVVVKGRYEIERLLGRGTTGTVYSAWDHELSREVAIKVLHQELLKNDEVLGRFEAETRITARLQHPGVVAVFDRGELPGGILCYTMSLAIGETLADYLDRLRFDEQQWQSASLIDRLTLFSKILDVISYAHAQGVVHRDLKPENIVLGTHGEVRILDWGLARSLREPEPHANAFEAVFGEDDGQTSTSERVRSDVYPTSAIGPDTEAETKSQNQDQPSHADSDSTRRTAHDGDHTRTQHSSADSTRQTAYGTDRIEHDPTKAIRSPGDGPRLKAEDATIIDQTLEAAGLAMHDAAPGQDETGSLDRPSTTRATRIGDVSSDRIVPDEGRKKSTSALQPLHKASSQASTRPPSTTVHKRSQSETGVTRVDRNNNERGTASERRRHTESTSNTGRHRRHSARIQSTSERSTRLGAVLGSPAYMSPEQARGEANRADERADIYSCGAILFEMLTLQTPVIRKEKEAIIQYIQRVQEGDRASLESLWPDAPKSLSVILDWALALDPQDRYPDCETFKEELRTILVQLSASFAEMERMRLAKEREGAWVRLGTWNYQAKPELEPFTDPVMATDGEPIGQVMHPELGGVLMGGCGLQVYPLAIEVADDLHVRMSLSLNRGEEMCVYVRGIPPHPCYRISVGAYSGCWMTISRLSGDQSRPMLLSMLPLHDSLKDNEQQRIELDVQVIGSNLTVVLNGQEQLEVRDPCPLIGPLHRQMAIASLESQLVVHEIAVDQRRAPLLVPSFHVASELLRQKLFPQAIDQYRRFLLEHADSDHSPEAHFMLCLAFLQAGHLKQAERELGEFLGEYIDSPLAQDAIFELARIKADHEKSIERAVRTVLSYQESDDHVRSRFCLWMMDSLAIEVGKRGLTNEVEEALKYLQHLISGFPDSALIMDTVAQGIDQPLISFGHRLIDENNNDALENLLDAVQRVRLRGYDLQVSGLRPAHWYTPLAKRMLELPPNHDDYADRIDSLLGHAVGMRDLLYLVTMGAGDPVLRWLQTIEEPGPAHRLLRAGLLHRAGQNEASQQDLQVCFQLIDILEFERTSQDVTATARLAFFALDYLPWEVVWDPISRIVRGEQLRALAAWLAEALGKPLESAEAYRSLDHVGTGFKDYAQSGLQRLGL